MGCRTVGVEYEWNANKFKFLDGAAVDRIESQIKDDENTRTLTKTFSIPEGANAFSVHLDWGQDLPLSEIAMVGPIAFQGTTIEGLLDIELMDLANTGVGVDILPFEVEIVNESSVTLFARQGDSIYAVNGSPPALVFSGSESQRQVTLSFTYLKTGGTDLQASDLKIQVAGHYPNSSINVSAPAAAARSSITQSAAPIRHAGSLLPLDLQYWMLGQHAAEASISLYLDDDAEGHDGRVITRGLPYGDHDEELGGGQAFAWSIEGHVPRPHHRSCGFGLQCDLQSRRPADTSPATRANAGIASPNPFDEGFPIGFHSVFLFRRWFWKNQRKWRTQHVFGKLAACVTVKWQCCGIACIEGESTGRERWCRLVPTYRFSGDVNNVSKNLRNMTEHASQAGFGRSRI